MTTYISRVDELSTDPRVGVSHRLLPKEENSNDILFFLEEKTENTNISASSFILYDIERKCDAPNPRGPVDHCQPAEYLCLIS